MNEASGFLLHADGAYMGYLRLSVSEGLVGTIRGIHEHNHFRHIRILP